MKLSILDKIRLFIKFPIGVRVATKKGCRIRGVFEGRVKGYSVWKEFQAINVRKDDGRVVQCLAKNLVRVK